jgi:hypothetical protein
LKGNYVDAKEKLRECLTLDPNHLLKGKQKLEYNNLSGYALNNLAVASWWTKFPNFKADQESEQGPMHRVAEDNSPQAFQQIDRDFANVIPLFKNAISNIENVAQEKDENKKAQLLELLDQDNIVPNDLKKFVS